MFIAGQLVVPVEAGAPNNAGSDGQNKTLVKQLRKSDGGVYPYVSAQSYRRALRDTMTALGAVPSPVERSGTGRKQQATTAADPVRYVDDDLFGYMHAVAKSEDGAGTVVRESVLWSGPLVAVAPVRPTEDFGTMTRGFAAGDDPVIHAHEFYTADLAAPFGLDLAQVGTFTAVGGQRPNFLPSAVAGMVEAGCVPVEFRGTEAMSLPIRERADRAAALLEAMAEPTGGAGRALNYTDRTPAIVVLVPMRCAVNPFGAVFGHIDGKLRFHHDAFRAALADWDDRVGDRIRIGWRTGYADDARAELVDLCQDLVEDGRLEIGEPRSTLRGLADDLRAGGLDHWFTDPR